MSEPKEDDLRVWCAPSYKMHAFTVPVASVEEGKDMMRLLIDYQYYLLCESCDPRIEVYEDGGWSELMECGSKGFLQPIKASEKKIAPKGKDKQRYFCYKVTITPDSILDKKGESIVVASSYAEAEKVVVVQCKKNPRLVESIECLGVAVIPDSLCESDMGVPTDG